MLHADIPAHAPVVSPGPLLIGVLLGVVVTMVSALLPALRATRVAPMAALRDQPTARVTSARWVVLRLVVALVVGSAGAVLTRTGTTMSDNQTATLVVVAGGVVAFLGVLIAAPLFVGPLTRLVGAAPARLFGVPAKLAVANARRNPGRTAVTTATLMIGVGMMALFAVVLASISATASDQLTGHYPLDYVVVGAGSAQSDATALLPPAYAAALRARPEFAAVAEDRVLNASVAGAASGSGVVAAFDPGSMGTLIQPQLDSGRLTDLTMGTTIVSSARNLTKTLKVGDVVTVTLRSASVRLRVVGTTTRTSIPGAQTADLLLTWQQLDALAGPGGDSSVLVKAASGVSPTASRDALDAVGQSYPLVQVTSVADLSSRLRSTVTGLIALFGALLGTAVVISLFGIANTLALSVLERTRESAMLRAIGLSRTQLRATLVTEAILMGVVGALVGVAYGLTYGRIVVTTAFSDIGPTVVVPWTWLGALVVVAALAALVAAILPARRAGRVSVVAGMADT